MADIQLRSYQQILGQMVSTLLATTDLNDLSPGSVFLTLLEAAASSDFTQEGKLLTLLNLRDVDKAKGVDLEHLAAELGVTPSRKGASAASVQLTVKDVAFTKISSNVFAGAISPIAGDTVLKVNSAASFSTSGTIYIGRGTATSEAVAYVSKVNSGSFWTLNLSSALTKDHFVNEEVVLAQGGDRSILTGTIAQVPSSAGSPAIQFSTTIDVTLPDGEDTVHGVSATAVTPGSAGNVGLNKIIEFTSPPFTTASVTNDQFPAAGGSDIETDAQLRQRIKDHVHNLSRGTERAILSTVIGVTDPDQGNRVVSAFIREPTSPTELGLLFIDDGTGFEPSFSGIGIEEVVSAAIGTEQFLQIQNFPIVKAQLASVGAEPFALNGGERLSFSVDGISEEKSLPNTQYRTPGVVLAQEVAQTINAVFQTVEARAKGGQLFVVPIKDDPDFLKVLTPSGTDANAQIQFPSRKQYTIRLFKNNILLNKNGSTASIQSFPNTDWPPFSSSETLQLRVDGVLSSLVTVTNADFASLTNSTTISGASPLDWATVLNARFIGITATAQSDGTVLITSNRGISSNAALSVVSGSLAGTFIDAMASAVGVSSQFKLNRLRGQIELQDRLEAGDHVTAGTDLTEGFVDTLGQPTFNLPTTLGTAAKFVAVTDFGGTILPVNQTVGTLTFSHPSAGITRITGTSGQFSSVLPDDWGYFYNLLLTGFVRVLDVDPSGAFVDCFYPTSVVGVDTPDGITKQFVFFRTGGLPQEVTLPIGGAVSSASVVLSINSQLSGGIAELLDNNIIQIRTQRLDGSSGLLIPLLAGSATNLGFTAGNFQSNDPQFATEESADLAGYPSGRLTVATPDTTPPYDTLTVSGTPFGSYIYNNRPVLDYIGGQAKLIRVPQILLSTSSMTLREDAPLQIDPIGVDLKAVTTCGLEFGQSDDIVVIMDDNPNEETFDIPMYVDATVAAPAVPTTTQFDAADSTGALLGSSSRWLGHRFEDYRVWFKGRADLPFNGLNSQMRISSVQFGPNSTHLRFGIFYPNTPSSPAIASYSINAVNGLVLVDLHLASGAARTISLVPNSEISVSSTGPVLGVYTWSVQLVPPADLTTVLVGDVVSLNDSAFNAANRAQFKVGTITNLTDFGRTYQFLPETFVSTDISGGVNFDLNAVPAQALRVGDKLTIGVTSALVLTVLTASTGILATSLPNGLGQTSVLTHKAITLDAPPSFVAAPGDKILAGGVLVTVTAVISTSIFDVDVPFAFTGVQTGSISRLILTGGKAVAAVSESVLSTASDGVVVMPLNSGQNTATLLETAVNNTAGVQSLVSASNSTGSNGSGTVAKSTEDLLSNGNLRVSLNNSESFIFSTTSGSPALTMKVPSDVVPELGEAIRLVPMTPENIRDHLGRKQISGLAIAAEVDLVNGARHVQISSRVPGGVGQVFVVGGKASGNNSFAVRGSGQEISSSVGQLGFDRSVIDFLNPGHLVFISQQGRARKSYVGSTPISSTTVQIQTVSPTTGKLTFGVALAAVQAYTHTGSVIWAVRRLSRGRLRFEVYSGTASLPGTLKADDWVFVGNGTSYAGSTPAQFFAAANSGYFQIRETDASTYFDVDASGFEQFVTASSAPFIFLPYHSARIGDQIVIGAAAPLLQANKGTFVITAVDSLFAVEYSNSVAVNEGPIALGSGGVASISILDQGYSTYRTVSTLAPDPNDPTDFSQVVFNPGYNLSLFNEGQNAVMRPSNRLGFSFEPVPGISGYQFWTGLKRRVQRTLDGYDPDPTTFPGTVAAGVGLEAREPQIQRVTLNIRVTTVKGVALSSISDAIKSSVIGFINSLGLGVDVVLSEVVSIIQAVSGVASVVLVNPVLETERITINVNAEARTSASEIVLS